LFGKPAAAIDGKSAAGGIGPGFARPGRVQTHQRKIMPPSSLFGPATAAGRFVRRKNGGADSRQPAFSRAQVAPAGEGCRRRSNARGVAFTAPARGCSDQPAARWDRPGQDLRASGWGQPHHPRHHQYLRLGRQDQPALRSRSGHRRRGAKKPLRQRRATRLRCRQSRAPPRPSAHPRGR